MHKSNSTFFNDLDDNRTELMLALFKDVMKPLKCGKETLKPKTINMGGTSCIFQKQIPPFTRYEISSRILCWDQKWLYVVSHFTKPGANKSSRYLGGSERMDPSVLPQKRDNGLQKDDIYATAMTKMVFKAGRITCSPESIFLECNLVPTQAALNEAQELENLTEGQHWSWEEMQKECSGNLHLAQNFANLDKLHTTFLGRAGPALYDY